MTGIDRLNPCDKDELYVTEKHVFFFGSAFSRCTTEVRRRILAK